MKNGTGTFQFTAGNRIGAEPAGLQFDDLVETIVANTSRLGGLAVFAAAVGGLIVWIV